MKTITVNRYIALLLRFTFAMLLFTLCRIFFYAFNLAHFEELNATTFRSIFSGGILFDISALLYLLSVHVFLETIPFKFRTNHLYSKISKGFYIIPISIGILANLADTVYYPTNLKRSTFAIFEQFSNERNLNTLMSHFLLEYWMVFVLFLAVTLFLIYSYNKIKSTDLNFKNSIQYYAYSTGILVLIVLLVIIGMRGDYKHSTRPLTLSNATKYISKPNQRALVLNTPFTLMGTSYIENLKEKHFFSLADQSEIYSAHHAGNSSTTFQSKNVVLLILESFGREHIGAFNTHIQNYSGFTPFLDSLIPYTYTFKHAFANGQKSISGMTSNIASIPTLKIPFVLSHNSGNKISSLAKTLRTQHYTTAFFHGAPNGSMGFDAFAHQAGFENYYGMTEYNNDSDFDGTWGIWDEEFFQYYAQEMNHMKEPFFTSLFSVSSHHPYKVPPRYENQFPEGKLPLQKTIAYTDYALSQFFKTAGKMVWFKNTLFIITADHSSTYSENSLHEYKSTGGIFSVPIIIYDPSNSEQIAFDDTTVVQQIDIMPTVLNLLGYPSDYLAFGTDMLDPGVEHFAINYQSGNFYLFKDEVVIQYDGKYNVQVFNYREDPHFSKNILEHTNIQHQKLLFLTQAFIQEYNRRMLRDEMVVNKN